MAQRTGSLCILLSVLWSLPQASREWATQDGLRKNCCGHTASSSRGGASGKTTRWIAAPLRPFKDFGSHVTKSSLGRFSGNFSLLSAMGVIPLHLSSGKFSPVDAMTPVLSTPPSVLAARDTARSEAHLPDMNRASHTCLVYSHHMWLQLIFPIYILLSLSPNFLICK